MLSALRCTIHSVPCTARFDSVQRTGRLISFSYRSVLWRTRRHTARAVSFRVMAAVVVNLALTSLVYFQVNQPRCIDRARGSMWIRICWIAVELPGDLPSLYALFLHEN